MKRSFIRMGLATLMISLTATAILHGQGGDVKKLPQSPREILRVELHGIAFEVLAYSADSKLLACQSGTMAMHVYETSTGKLVHRLAKERSKNPAYAATFSPTADKLVTVHDDGIRLWCMNSGKLTELEPLPGLKPPFSVRQCFFCEEGKSILAVIEARTIQQWDAATGRTIRNLGDASKLGSNFIGDIRLSQDGRTLAVEDWKVIDSERLSKVKSLTTQRVAGRLWDISSGRIVSEIGNAVDFQFVQGQGQKKQVGNHDVARPLRQVGIVGDGFRFRVSPSGKLLYLPYERDEQVLQISGRPGEPLQVTDRATGKELLNAANYHLGNDNSKSATLSPNNKILAAFDASDLPLRGDFVLLDISHLRRDALKNRKPLTAKEFGDLWQELGTKDFLNAFQSMRRLGLHSDDVVTFVEKQFTASPDHSKKIFDLILQLDDQQFKARQQAESNLAHFGEETAAAAKKALAKPISEEARQRLKTVLEVIKQQPGPDADTRRLISAIVLLEEFATPAAKKLLERIAQGGPEQWVTQEAVATLDRLATRSKQKVQVAPERADR